MNSDVNENTHTRQIDKFQLVSMTLDAAHYNIERPNWVEIHVCAHQNTGK